ncbi:uncharacterized protein LOC120545309 [Perca fluviatilis]|uniref:uncharacterized protein LOC120545309 n=1 Tax=Perca fluviatilis TaxID=8168 RepID=UPI0019654FFB|nr:uncharacterized protein LOC120545309 [Perca fluviatilis]XP_039635490.1 uncharacterized protein LOC120545309 [Perca fluviatilis]
MASTPRRRRRMSIVIPPDLSELMDQVKELAVPFVREFDSSEPKMQEIEGEFRNIAEVRKMQKRTDKNALAIAGAVIGGLGIRAGVGIGAAVGIGLLVFAAPFTEGASLAAVAPLAVAAGAVAGGAVVAGVNSIKTMKANRSIKKVKKLAKDFKEITEPLKIDLEEIKRTCEKLEQRSAGLQAGITLTDMEDFQRILRRVSELAERSGEVLSAAVKVMSSIDVKVFRVTATPEEDKKLTDSIIQSADRCQEVVVKFDQMKKELKDFTEK